MTGASVYLALCSLLGVVLIWVLPRSQGLNAVAGLTLLAITLISPASALWLAGTTLITVSINDTWAATEANISDDTDPNAGYRLRLVYVDDDSKTRVHDLYFDLVRYKAGHNVAPQDVDARLPGWIHDLPPDYQEDQGRDLIDAAYEQVALDMVRTELPDVSAVTIEDPREG